MHQPGNLTAADLHLLQKIQFSAFTYFQQSVHPETGLVADSDKQNSPASIAVTGMGITCYCIAVSRGWIARQDAARVVHKQVSFLSNAEQSRAKDAAGYQGFFYHFLHMPTGKRAWSSELSTIDTALLMAGVLMAASFFNGNDKLEVAIRNKANELYEAVNWKWALHNTSFISHGWKPGSGFLKHSWQYGYSEATILYILALGSAAHAIPGSSYKKWTDHFYLETAFGFEHIAAPPLFIHQFSQCWLPLQHALDEFNQKTGFSYFENSARATKIHRQYAIQNPNNFRGYHKNSFGLSACDGPGKKTKMIDKRKIQFLNYAARGVLPGVDDGTLATATTVASLPFAPQHIMPFISNYVREFCTDTENFKIPGSHNPTFLINKKTGERWCCPWRYGLHEGSMMIMIENYLSGFVWENMQQNPVIQKGMRQAGFRAPWL